MKLISKSQILVKEIQEKDPKREQLDSKMKKKEFERFKKLAVKFLVGAALVISAAAATYKCSDSPTDNPITETDAGTKADVGESKDAGPKDAGAKDAETEDASDAGPKDVETPDEDKPDVGPTDVGPTDAGAEVETPDSGDAGPATDGGPQTDGGDTESADVPQPVDGGNDASVEDASSDAETTDANGGDESSDVGQNQDVGPQTDGGDQQEDAGMTKELCDEYLGTTIPDWANDKVPLDMFLKYFSGVTGFAEKIDALKNYMTDINGEVVVLLGKVNDPSQPCGVRIISTDVLFGVAGVPKMDGTTADGLCRQIMVIEELNAAYQVMMSEIKR